MPNPPHGFVIYNELPSLLFNTQPYSSAEPPSRSTDASLLGPAFVATKFTKSKKSLRASAPTCSLVSRLAVLTPYLQGSQEGSMAEQPWDNGVIKWNPRADLPFKA